jgi:hypothetical protein
MPKLRLLIFDANVVFELHELGLWQAVLGECEIYLSKLVAEKEVRFYKGQEFDEIIDLSPAINAGQLTIFEVGVSEVQKFRERFDGEYLSKLDDGEAESLTHMLACQPGDWLISSSDAIVFRVLGNLNEAERGISLEEILTKLGRTTRGLKRQFTKKFREEYTAKGSTERIYGRGLRHRLSD